MRSRHLALLGLAFAFVGCYHATIDTGLAPSGQTIEQPWASAWIYGLVPPATIETASKCPGGVSKVETQLSFLNQLVSFLTIGIYTPMDIRVSCAAAGKTSLDDDGTIKVGSGASAKERAAAMRQAVKLSAERGKAVYVEF